MKRVVVTFALILGLFFSVATPANGARPNLNVGCFDLIEKGSDSRGRYIEYQPSLSANFVGKKWSIEVYINEVLQYTNKYVRATNSYRSLARFDAPVRFYADEINLGENSFKFILQDSKRNKSIWICNTTLYESSFGSINPNTGSFNLKLLGCRYNGQQLFGSVFFTTNSSAADFSVYVKSTSSSADLKVYLASTSSSANSCGKWYPTNDSSFADFIVYVTSSSFLANFSIYVTNSSSSAGTN